MPGLYPSVLDSADIEYLSTRSRWTRVCPTCQSKQPKVDKVTTYLWNGVIHDCLPDEDNFCIQFKWHTLYERANVPYNYQRFDFNKDFTLQDEAKTMVLDYINSLQSYIDNGVGLYLHSQGLGTGKTSIATYILKEGCKKGIFGYYVQFHELISLYQEEEYVRRRVEGQLLRSPILIIDDVVDYSSDRQGDYFALTLERVIRNRVHNALPCIITSNLDPDTLGEQYNRVFSLLSESTMVLKLPSIDDARPLMHEKLVKAAGNNERPPIT